MLTDRTWHEKHDFRAFQNELVTCRDDKNRRDAYRPVARHRDVVKFAKYERKSVNPALEASFGSTDPGYTKKSKMLDIELQKLKIAQRRKLII